jgi:protein tyrosine phosphatase (PTP) superfamily phosphohydrolase (DUF442 family)
MSLTPCSILAALLLFAAGAAAEPAIKRMEIGGIENFFSVTDSIYSGGGPETEEAFRALAKLGVKTIITVDGAKPNLELARRHGLRYIHIPHGYDGIPNETAVKLVKAASTVEGPLYVHCHHGKHRGPAAVGVICQSLANWSPEEAESWLKKAGTAADYTGLYQSVRAFRRPRQQELAKVPGDFPAAADVSAMVDTMVEIDQHWDRLNALTSKMDSPEKAASEAVLLWEQFREAQRLPESARLGNAFQDEMSKSEKGAQYLRELLSAHAKGGELSAPNLRGALDEIAQSCKRCHQDHRDSNTSKPPRQ